MNLATKSPPPVMPDHIETRRNAATCYRARNSPEARYAGVMVIDNLPTGTKAWVNIAVRQVKSGPRSGETYFSVSIQPQEQGRES